MVIEYENAYFINKMYFFIPFEIDHTIEKKKHKSF